MQRGAQGQGGGHYSRSQLQGGIGTSASWPVLHLHIEWLDS
jgi:hypothetical protein